MEETMTLNAADRADFAVQLEAHRGIVFKVANTYCRNAEDRADLAQEISTQLWRAWSSYDPARPLSTWMYRIALNVAISFVRSDIRRRRHSIPLDESVHNMADPNARDPETDSVLRRLQAFIDKQPALDRALLMLYLDERSQREIGEILGITESNVSTKIGRLKQRLRNEL